MSALQLLPIVSNKPLKVRRADFLFPLHQQREIHRQTRMRLPRHDRFHMRHHLPLVIRRPTGINAPSAPSAQTAARSTTPAAPAAEHRNAHTTKTVRRPATCLFFATTTGRPFPPAVGIILHIQPRKNKLIRQPLRAPVHIRPMLWLGADTGNGKKFLRRRHRLMPGESIVLSTSSSMDKDYCAGSELKEQVRPLQNAATNVARPANGLRCGRDFPYSSQRLFVDKGTVADKNPPVKRSKKARNHRNTPLYSNLFDETLLSPLNVVMPKGAFTIPPAEQVVEIFETAGEENKLSTMRSHQVVTLPAEGEVWMTGDIHDHRTNFNKLMRDADLANNPQRHLILHELIHGDHFDAKGAEDSWQTLYRAAELKCDFPNQVHFLLANHDLAQIHGEGIMKAGLSVCEAFTAGVKRDFGSTTASPSPSPNFCSRSRWRFACPTAYSSATACRPMHRWTRLISRSSIAS